MSDLDVIREAQDYLAGLLRESGDSEWEAVQRKSGTFYRIDAGDDRITYDTEGGEIFHESDARLIVALRAAAPYLLGELREAERYFVAVHHGAANNRLDWALDTIALAGAILATKGQE